MVTGTGRKGRSCPHGVLYELIFPLNWQFLYKITKYPSTMNIFYFLPEKILISKRKNLCKMRIFHKSRLIEGLLKGR